MEQEQIPIYDRFKSVQDGTMAHEKKYLSNIWQVLPYETHIYKELKQIPI